MFVRVVYVGFHRLILATTFSYGLLAPTRRLTPFDGPSSFVVGLRQLPMAGNSLDNLGQT